MPPWLLKILRAVASQQRILFEAIAMQQGNCMLRAEARSASDMVLSPNDQGAKTSDLGYCVILSLTLPEMI